MRRLPRKEQELLNLLELFRGCLVSTDRAMQWLYGHRDDPPFDNNIRVLICSLRRRGIAIENRHGVGWELV